MDIPREKVDKVVEAIIAALPDEAEDDYDAWLENPTDEGLAQLLAKYHVDANKIAREIALEEENA